MNYREVYTTLNGEQHKKLMAVMDKALLRSKLPDDIIIRWIMQGVYENCPELNRDQRWLFHDIVEYIVINRDRVRQVIHEAMKKEFFEGIDRLMAEQKSLKGGK